uniref:ShKT domain-containing protein n=1 Tax=Ditylenchus dipsaci TaxID=166011 RepID=A0A915DAP5_9BILA
MRLSSLSHQLCEFVSIAVLICGINAQDLNSFNSSPSQTFSSSSQFSGASCVDSDPKCQLWAGQGECQSNAVWMMSNCRRSCQSCQGGDKAWQLRNQLAKNYDNATANPNSTIARLVRIESARINHVEIDEAKQLVRLFGRMVLSWNDSKVVWDKDAWGISWLNFYWIQVWTPQLVQINAPMARKCGRRKSAGSKSHGAGLYVDRFPVCSSLPLPIPELPK